ncbi:putative F-box protein [Tanacetum coccineum]
MSVNNIPFDIQTEIMQRLPVKSLVRFQLVSKQWKSLIDSPEFIKNHCRTIDTHYQHHLFVLQAPDRDYTYHYTFKYLSIIDNDVYPDQKSSYTIPPLLRSFRNIDKDYFTCGGMLTFLLLSSRAWKRLYTGHKPVSDQCGVTLYHVCIKGCIYWQASDPSSGEYTNVIVSFDLKSEMFSKVCLPDRLLLARKLRVAEVNESLGVLEYDSDGGCGVWMMDFATKSFSKMFTVKVPGQLLYNGVLGFRKNGEVIIKAKDDNKYGLAAYEPSSGRVKGIQIHGGIKEFGDYGSMYKHTHTHTQSLQRFACEDGRRVFSAIRIEQNYIKAQLQLMSSLLALLLQFEVLYLAMILEFK